MYSRLHFLTSACLIAFGTVVVAGAIGVLPGLIERLSVGAVEVPPSCKDEIRLPWGRTCSSQAVTPSVAARLPGADVQVADHVDQTTSLEPPQGSQNTASAAIDFMRPRESLAPAQQLASAPATTEEAPQATPTVQALPIAPSVKPKARPVKKVAGREPSSDRREPSSERREPNSERRRDEALRTVRRFGGTREIPADAYAAESGLRRMMIRPTSIQDVYYYYGRR